MVGDLGVPPLIHSVAQPSLQKASPSTSCFVFLRICVYEVLSVYLSLIFKCKKSIKHYSKTYGKFQGIAVLLSFFFFSQDLFIFLLALLHKGNGKEGQ